MIDTNDPDYQAGAAVGRFVGAMIAGALLSAIPWTIAYRREMEGLGKVAVLCIFVATYFLPQFGLLLAIVSSIVLLLLNRD